VAWVLDRREEASTRAIREHAFVAQARAEITDRDYAIAMLDLDDMGEDCRDASRWTMADEDAYQRSRAREREIEASKRGDLLAAARFAEVAGG
jgi:hypothetical protein